MKICFDMDGTIANLYGVENWLEYLIAEDVKPYAEAKVMLNMSAVLMIIMKQLPKQKRLGLQNISVLCSSMKSIL